MRLAAPRAEKRRKNLSAHGDLREDPWYWLRFREDPAVMEYLQAENQYTEDFFSGDQKLREALYQELCKSLPGDDRSVPIREGAYWYYSEVRKGQQYPAYYRSLTPELNDPELLLDVNQLAAGHDYCDLAYCLNSPDHRFLAYAVDFEGDESWTLHIVDLLTGSPVGASVSGVSDSFEWFNNSKVFLYSRLDSSLCPRQIWSRDLDALEREDVLVYAEKDDKFLVSLDKSENSAGIYLCIDGNNMSECYRFDADMPGSEPVLIHEREAEHEIDVSEWGEDLFIRTNRAARDYKIVRVPLKDPVAANWVDFFPAREGRLIEDFLLFQDHMVICERSGGLQGVSIFDFKEGSFSSPDLSDGDMVFDLSLAEQREFASDELRYCLQSLHRSPEIRSFHFRSGEIRLLKKENGSDPQHHEKDYITKLLFAPLDGEEPGIPVSLVHHKDVVPGPETPLLLSAYGAYGCISDMDYCRSVLPLLRRGFIYGQAHVRGGMELGQAWYENGKLLSKKNSFEDYLTASRFLIDQNYTAKGNIIATGASAGGLVMGYVANEAPELYRGILAQVPFVDILTTMLDSELPLTAGEFNEWGNPEDKTYYDYIKSYSPYDNVRKQNYPAIFASAGISDMRVPYWEPAKWMAKLRSCQQGDATLLLLTQMDSGHAGASGRYDSLKEIATELLWILKICGWQEPDK